MKITNMTNSSGHAIANQFILEDENGRVFFKSYDSMIAIVVTSHGYRNVTLGKHWEYSHTTMKYLKHFLMTHYTGKPWDAHGIREAIASGQIKYDPELV